MAFSFGAPNTTSLGFGGAVKPAFGNTSFPFGANVATTSASTGFGTFGVTPATTNTGGFSGFGTNTATANTGFGGFGTATTSAPPPFGAFGSTQTTSAPSLFGGTGAFGAPASTASTFTGFGTNTTTAFGVTPQSGGFGTTGFGQTNTGFGANNTGFGATGTNPGFGTNSGTGFGSSFGTGSTFNTGTGFGSSFMNKPLGGTTGFPGFGSGGFGQQHQQQQQPQSSTNIHEALTNAVFNCTVFGDERDHILAKWNFLQAKWGIGKAYYANNQPPIELTEQNPLCRFKAIGYSCMPTVTDKHGLVQLTFNKTEEEIKNQQAQLVTSLSSVFGNKPNLTINVESIKGMAKNNTQAIIYVMEKSATGLSGSRLAASEVAQYLNQPHIRSQLNNLTVTSVLAHVRPEGRHLQEYLNTAPPGIDHRLWNQAQADNPDPEKYLPVPMVGFAEVKWRMQCQEEETKLHAVFLNKTAADLAELKAKLAASIATLQEQSRRHMHLHHRLLAVVVRQESARRAGAAMTREEETLRSRLEALHSQLTAPTQFNGRLSELLSQMRMQRYQNTSQTSERYTMDPGYQEDIKKVLAQHQKGMSHLIETVQTDLAHIKIIQEGMSVIVNGGADS